MTTKLVAGGKWTRSSYSGNEHGSDCVEVAVGQDAVLIRDSKDIHRARIAVGPEAWAAFLGAVTVLVDGTGAGIR
ncbi:DUF397 domain-containing protein [Streptomyces sp. NPDC047117]|uniref:DUF397 domain-containing protein n=1 Tax=Streptomyces sp. NPDC047117 TaxID=3155379 RepID=UPI0033DA5C9C